MRADTKDLKEFAIFLAKIKGLFNNGSSAKKGQPSIIGRISKLLQF